MFKFLLGVMILAFSFLPVSRVSAFNEQRSHPPVAVNELATTTANTPVPIDLTAGSSGNPTSAALVGTLILLFVVGVALDTVQQIESHLITRHYEGFTGPRGPRIRGRRDISGAPAAA